MYFIALLSGDFKGPFQNLPLFLNARSYNAKADPPKGSLLRDFCAPECKTVLLLSSLNTKLNTKDKVGYLLGFESRTQDITAALLIKTLISSIQRSML